MEPDKTEYLSETEHKITLEIEELMPGFFNRDRDALLGRVIRKLVAAEPEKPLYLYQSPHGLATAEFARSFYDGVTILEAALRALQEYLEKKERK